MLRIALLLLLLACGGAAGATDAPAPAPAWTDEAPGLPTVRRAGIAVAREAGSLKLKEVRDYSTEGLDDVAQYASADEAISGTIFIYFPSLADTGLTFLATDATIRSRFGPTTRIAEDKLVAVGGVAGAGRKIVYAGASDGLRSTTATFVRAGGWIVVLRVSGPASRAAEIAADIDALAAGMTFGMNNNPVPAHVIATSDCAAGGDKDAPLNKPEGGEIMGLLLVAASGTLRDEKRRAVPDELGRVPDQLCLARSGTQGETIVLTYRTVGKPTGIYAPKLFQLIGDAGSIIEATATLKRPARSLVMRHQIGRLQAFGLFEGTPSLAQIDRISRHDPSFPVVGEASFKPEGGSELQLDCNEFREGCGSPRNQPHASAPQPSAPSSSSR